MTPTSALRLRIFSSKAPSALTDGSFQAGSARIAEEFQEIRDWRGSPGSLCTFTGTPPAKTNSLRSLCIPDGDKQIVHPHRRGDDRLLGHVADERFEGRTVGLDPVGPRIAAENLIDLVEVGGHPGQHVAERSQEAHLGEGAVLRFAERVVKARGDERVLLVELAANDDEVHDREDAGAPVVLLLDFPEIREQALNVRVAPDRRREARPGDRVDRPRLEQLVERSSAVVDLKRHFLEKRQGGGLAVSTRFIDRSLDPAYRGKIDAVFVLKMPANPDRRGHRIQWHPDPPALEVLGRPDPGLAVDGDEAVPERARGKNRERHERTVARRLAADEFRARHFGGVEFELAPHAVENFTRRVDGDEIQIDSLRPYLARVKRQHAVVQPA